MIRDLKKLAATKILPGDSVSWYRGSFLVAVTIERDVTLTARNEEQEGEDFFHACVKLGVESHGVKLTHDYSYGVPVNRAGEDNSLLVAWILNMEYPVFRQARLKIQQLNHLLNDFPTEEALGKMTKPEN